MAAADNKPDSGPKDLPFLWPQARCKELMLDRRERLPFKANG